MSSSIRVTPLLGGQSEGGVCSLLEIGGARILLDCGYTNSGNNIGNTFYSKLLADNNGIDVVLLSHADMDHMGSLPLLLGRSGLQGVPIVCTVPVHKFGQLLLYDHCLNKGMEGLDPARLIVPKGLDIAAQYELDDIDIALSNVFTVRYSQTVSLADVCDGRHKQITLCAYSSGRTIGGSIWRIRHGATEVLYVMDVNLKREVVLDGANIASLPMVPALMIVDGASAKKTAATNRRKKTEENELLTIVMETLRSEQKGNVVIPCETGGRALEILQILGRHWMDTSNGLDHLIFLSHMSHNVLEFARSQLEWMRDDLTKGFFNGRPNPFDLPAIKTCTSVKEVEKFKGSKVVVATDPSLSCGLSKELLLKWGGDPRCKVIFIDQLDSHSLAVELMAQTPPIIMNLTKPIRVDLVGEELEQYHRGIETKKRLKDAAQQRKRNEEEFFKLMEVNNDVNEDDLLKGGTLEMDDVEAGADNDKKKRKVSTKSNASKWAKLSENNSFPRFASNDVKDDTFTVDVLNYGCSILDLKFQDITTTTIKKANNGNVTTTNVQNKSKAQQIDLYDNESIELALAGITTVPWKLTPVKIRTQFTCTFKDLPTASGRADFKATRNIMNKLAPVNVVVLRGSQTECSDVVIHAKMLGIESFAPLNGKTVSFDVQAGRVRLNVPPSTLNHAPRSLSGVVASQETICNVCVVNGAVMEETGAASEGIRVVWLQQSVDKVAVEADAEDLVEAAPGDDIVAKDDDVENRTAKDEVVNAQEDEQLVLSTGANIGMLSVGEVTFDRIMNTVKKQYEREGISIELREGMLIVGSQVIVRKENENDFILEGPPVPAFWQVRKCLYENFSYI